MPDEFPSNSRSSREGRPTRERPRSPEEKQIARVTTSKATLRRKPLRKKFVDAFRPEDNKGFVEYTVLEVLVPGIKDALADAVHGTIDNALGTNVSPHRRRGGGGGYTSYNRMSTSRSRGRGRDRDDDRPSRRESRVADDVREVILPSRVEADEVLDAMYETLQRYDVVSMRDLMGLIGEPINPVHEDWGWYNLGGSRIHRMGGGYLIDLPRPEPLD